MVKKDFAAATAVRQTDTKSLGKAMSTHMPQREVNMAFCPDDQTLAAFIDKTLPREKRSEITNHLTECNRCLAIVGEILKTRDDLGQAARRPTLRRYTRLAAPMALAASLALMLLYGYPRKTKEERRVAAISPPSTTARSLEQTASAPAQQATRPSSGTPQRTSVAAVPFSVALVDRLSASASRVEHTESRKVYGFTDHVSPGGAANLEIYQNRTAFVANYGVVTAKQNPRVAAAEEIFGRVLAVTDTSGRKNPRLLVTDERRNIRVEAIKDGAVVLSIKAVDLCFKSASDEAARSRLAFLVAHELGHQANNHFWHQDAYQNINAFAGTPEGKAIKAAMEKGSDVKDNGDVAKLKEFQADADGVIFMAMAGYDPQQVMADDGSNFFEWWVMQTNNGHPEDPSDTLHPRARERATAIRAQLAPVIEFLEYYRLGVRQMQIGGYEDAITLFERFREKFPSREVLNNIGLAHYQIALEKLGGCDKSLLLGYRLATALDTVSLAEGMASKGISRGTRQDTSTCFNDEGYKAEIKEAVRFLEMAKDRDPEYLPARINLSSALIMAGDYPRALSVANEVVKPDADATPVKALAPLYVNRGVALFLFGRSSNMAGNDTALASLNTALTLEPDNADALYNKVAIFSERKLDASAKEACRDFLKVELAGVFADAVRKIVGIAGEPVSKAKQVAPPFAIPVRLGRIADKSATARQLAGMTKRELPVGSASGANGMLEWLSYKGGGITVYVLDNVVQIVEAEPPRPLDAVECRRRCGEPVRTIATPAGQTLVYPTFALDIAEQMVKKVVFFESSG